MTSSLYEDHTSIAPISGFDAALVVTTAISTVLVGEGISWALIYRRQHYQSLVLRHKQLRDRQRFLTKFMEAEQGKSCPEKYELKSIYDTLRHIKKELFKVFLRGFILFLRRA